MMSRLHRFADAAAFQPEGHAGVSPVRLTGTMADESLNVVVSTYSPGAHAEVSPVAIDTVYVLLTGQLTITIDDELDEELDRYMRARGYDNRSEALRDLARAGLQQDALEVAGSRPCVAALIYVYDHDARDLPKRLTHDFHERHDLARATLHMHLDHDSCMEVTVLKGRGSDVQKFADHIIAERGVRHGHVVYLPADGAHTHGRGGSHNHAQGHSHSHKPGKTG